jgi:hypothetical protein
MDKLEQAMQSADFLGRTFVYIVWKNCAAW